MASVALKHQKSCHKKLQTSNMSSVYIAAFLFIENEVSWDLYTTNEYRVQSHEFLFLQMAVPLHILVTMWLSSHEHMHKITQKLQESREGQFCKLYAQSVFQMFSMSLHTHFHFICHTKFFISLNMPVSCLVDV